MYLFLAWIALYTAAAVILAYRHRPGILKNYCASLALTASALLLIFTLFCGINYHSVCFSENEGFSMERSSKEELRELCVFLAEEINRCDMALAEKANRGDTALPMEGDVRFTSPDMMEQQAVLAIKEAGKTYESLSGFTPEPKAVWQSGLHGIRSAAVCLQRSYAGIQPCYGRAVECRGEGCISGDLRWALSECERGFAGGQHILASVLREGSGSVSDSEQYILKIKQSGRRREKLRENGRSAAGVQTQCQVIDEKQHSPGKGAVK